MTGLEGMQLTDGKFCNALTGCFEYAAILVKSVAKRASARPTEMSNNHFATVFQKLREALLILPLASHFSTIFSSSCSWPSASSSLLHEDESPRGRAGSCLSNKRFQ